jgi:hypothetical protein
MIEGIAERKSLIRVHGSADSCSRTCGLRQAPALDDLLTRVGALRPVWMPQAPFAPGDRALLQFPVAER